MAAQMWVTIGSGNGTKPLPELCQEKEGINFTCLESLDQLL